MAQPQLDSLRALGDRRCTARIGHRRTQLDDGLGELRETVGDEIFAARASGGFQGRVLDALRRAHVEIPVVVMTVFAHDSVRALARRLGAIGLLKKAFDVDDLRTAVWNARAAVSRSQERNARATRMTPARAR